MRRFLMGLLGALLLPGVAAAQTAELADRTILRVCADPGNMPFSNEKGEGFENKIADLIAADLGIPLVYTYFPMATGFVRKTLGENRCDVVMGYAQGGELVQNTNHYYRTTYALVVPTGGDLASVESLEDPRLKGLSLGIIAGTPPATIMALNGLIGRARPYNLMVDRRFESPAEDMIHDIEKGEIAGGILWGPMAGYYARAATVPMTIIPLVKETKGPRMAYRITFGIRHGETLWKRQLNRIIRKNQDAINAILLDFGVPILDEQDQPIVLAKQ